MTTTDLFLFGGARCLFAFPLEHPLEVAKLKCQSNPGLSSGQNIKAIFEAKGCKGFFEGGLSNLGKRTVKVAYRWPTVAALYSFWDGALPKPEGGRSPGAMIATAGSIAAVETAVVLPFERLFIAKVVDSQYASFIQKQLKQEGAAALYRGATASFLSHASSWMVFMGANQLGKEAARALDPEKESPLKSRALNVAIASTALTAVDMPLEFIKAQTQLHAELQTKSFPETAALLFKRHGPRGLYSGLAFGFLHKTAQTVFGAAFFEQMTR